MVCKTRGKGSYGNSPTQDQRKEPKPENNFKKKEKAISLCPNQLNHTIKGASSIGNSTYCELTTELYTHTHTHTHTLSLEPVWALIFLTGRGGLDTTFKKKNLFWLCCVVCEISVSWRGTEPRSLQWKHRILTTGPPGNSLDTCLNLNKTWAQHHFNLLLLSSHLDAKTLQLTDRGHMTRRLKAHRNTGNMLLGPTEDCRKWGIAEQPPQPGLLMKRK